MLPPPSRDGHSRLAHELPLGLAVLIILLATLVPSGTLPPRFWWRLEAPDVLVNLLLYLPLGVLLARRGAGVPRVALLAALLSLTIELLQGSVIPGRRGSPADVVANTAGALAGAALFAAWRHTARRPTPGRVAGATAVLLLPPALWAASGALLAPVAPETLQWYGQWAHHFINTEPFRGSIRSVTLFGRAIPDDRADSTAALQAAERAGPVVLEVTLRSGGTTGGVTHLASVADGEGAYVVGLEQLGDDLQLAWWSRGAALGLRAPRVTFPGLLAAPPGDSLAIRAIVRGGLASAEVRDGGVLRQGSRRLTPLTGWRSLIPTRDLSPEAQSRFDLVWTLGCAGYLLFALRLLRRLRG